MRSAMSKQAHVERYVPAGKDDGETRYFWKWNVGCPDQDNCSKRFAGIKSNFFSYEGEEAVREQLSNHLYSSTKHKSVNTWPKAMEMVQDFENQSEEPAIVMEEETFEERDQYRKEYEEMLKLQNAKNAKDAKKANVAKKTVMVMMMPPSKVRSRNFAQQFAHAPAPALLHASALRSNCHVLGTTCLLAPLQKQKLQ